MSLTPARWLSFRPSDEEEVAETIQVHDDGAGDVLSGIA